MQGRPVGLLNLGMVDGAPWTASTRALPLALATGGHAVLRSPSRDLPGNALQHLCTRLRLAGVSLQELGQHASGPRSAALRMCVVINGVPALDFAARADWAVYMGRPATNDFAMRSSVMLIEEESRGRVFARIDTHAMRRLLYNGIVLLLERMALARSRGRPSAAASVYVAHVPRGVFVARARDDRELPCTIMRLHRTRGSNAVRVTVAPNMSPLHFGRRVVALCANAEQQVRMVEPLS